LQILLYATFAPMFLNAGSGGDQLELILFSNHAIPIRK
jgi:hypothetical protein